MHVAIIGNGVAGVTAAMRLRELQPDCRITLISGESEYHYSRPAIMYLFMGHMTYRDTKPFENHVWSELRIDRLRDWVLEVDTERRTLRLHRGGELAWDRLLIATGSKSNRFGWPGQDLAGVQGLYDLMDLKRLYENTERCRRAVIVGGGLIGIELAEMLHTRGIHVTFLVRESTYWGNVLPRDESAMINRAIREQRIELRLETELEEILDDGRGRVAEVATKGGDRIACELVGLTAGVGPNIDLVREHDAIETGRGVLVDDRLRASADDVFAAGDCAEIRRPGEARNLVQQVWYTGKRQGAVAGENLAGATERYEPGIWFNSAKFFDIEYQTYGTVPASLEGLESAWWGHENGRHGMRIAWDRNGVRGFNFMGLRHSHRVCERWIAEGRDPRECIDRIGEARFDPEFARSHVRAMQAALRVRL